MNRLQKLVYYLFTTLGETERLELMLSLMRYERSWKGEKKK